MSNLHTFQGLRRMRRAPFNPIPTTLLGYRMTSFGQTKQQNHLTLGKNCGKNSEKHFLLMKPKCSYYLGYFGTHIRHNGW